jgi:hypothetical protein
VIPDAGADPSAVSWARANDPQQTVSVSERHRRVRSGGGGFVWVLKRRTDSPTSERTSSDDREC